LANKKTGKAKKLPEVAEDTGRNLWETPTHHEKEEGGDRKEAFGVLGTMAKEERQGGAIAM